MYVLIIIAGILMTIPAVLLANKYTEEKQSLKSLIPIYLIAIIIAEIIIMIMQRDHSFLGHSLFRGISECGIAVSVCYMLIYIVMNERNRKHGRFHKLRNIWIFLVIFLNGIASISRILHLSSIEREIPGLLLQLVLDIGVYIILFNLLAKERIEIELKELHYYMEIEKIRYQEMEKEREAMAKLRHDYNNQLTSVLGLLHMNREEEARELLKEMRSERYD